MTPNPCHAPPFPIPYPKLRINDHVIGSKEREPASTASPSTPSSLLPELREMLAEGRKRANCLEPKPKPADREHLEAVARKAIDAPGDTVAILTGAVGVFFADDTQRKYRYSPAGLAHGFDTYAAEVLERQAEAFKAQKRAAQDEKLKAIDAAIFAREAQQKAARQRQPEANGTAARRGGPAEPLAEPLVSIAKAR